MKIGVKLILGFLTLVFIFGIAGYISINTSQKILQKSIGENSVTLAQEILDKIDRHIYYKIEEFQAYSKDLTLQEAVIKSNNEFEKLDNIQNYINEKDKEWTSAPEEAITSFMQELISNKLSEELREKIKFHNKKYGYKVFGEVFVTNKYGANAAQTGKTTDYYQADEEWWQKAKEDGLYVTDIEYDKSADVYFTDIGIRIEDEDGNFLGVMKVVLNIRGVIDTIEELEKTAKYETTAYKLLTKECKIICSTEEFEFLKDVSDEEFAQVILSRRGEIVSPDETYFITKGDKPGEGEKLFAHAHSKGCKDFKGLGWILVVEYEAQEIFAPVIELRNIIFIVSFAVAIFAVLIGVSLSGSISKSVRKLKDSADKISKGNLAEPIEIKGKDEISELAKTFDDMRYSLKMVIEEYEKMKGREELIKKLKKTEEQLELSERKYRMIFEGARDGILAADQETKKFVFANPEICKLTGYSEKELLKLGVEDIHPKKDLPYVIDQFTKQVKGEIELAKNIPVLRKDKKIIYCDVNSTPVVIGEHSLLLGFFRDVSQERKRVEQLERFAKLSTGREEKMIELKKKMKELEKQIGKKEKR